MLGFKQFRNAAATISGIELMLHIRKGQFDLFALGLKDTVVPSVWNAVLFNQSALFRLIGTLAPDPLKVRHGYVISVPGADRTVVASTSDNLS
ncbi:hypothetical protein ABH944_008643 [Caballeronia udeis]|jgi:hypothetical protein|uniref:Uncharacterized protein n=1 Tax=Caballeronia udeis TaxID=1232866 RepID=A0ABW8MXU4_9BURK